MRHDSKFLIIFVFGLIFFALAVSIISDKHLSADGVNYFIIILDTKDFYHSGWSRQFADYLSQLPIVLSVNSGIRDISVLRTVFGVGVLLPYFLAFGLSLFALRHEDKSIIIFMIISMVSINLASDYILAGEHHVMALMAWPILFFLVRRVSLQWFDAILLWSLLFVFSGLYETALIPATIFLAIGLSRIAYSVSEKQKFIFLVTILFSALTIAISAYFILYPLNPANKASFSRVIIKAWSTPESLTNAVFILLFVLGWMFRRSLAVWGAIIPIAIYALYVIQTGHSLSARQSFAGRTLTLNFLPALIIAAVGIHWKEQRIDFRIAVVSVLFVVTMVAANIYSTHQWRQFKAQMIKVLAEEKGLVPIEATTLQRWPQRWSWNNSQLSVVWSDGCVQAVILNRKNLRWEPSRPPEVFPLQEYTCYTSEFGQYDGDICLCNFGDKAY